MTTNAVATTQSNEIVSYQDLWRKDAEKVVGDQMAVYVLD